MTAQRNCQSAPVLQDKTILLTGGTGTFGQACVETLLAEFKLKKIIVFSRDEAKQHEMRKVFPDDESSPIRYFIGDVRSKARLLLALRGVDIVIHEAAMKQIPACEYNPFEAVRTNVEGAENLIEAAVGCGVQKVIALSSDKAVDPINMYGATKLTAEKLFVASNTLGPKFSVVRYGNVLGSRGSVLPAFLEQKKTDSYSLTDDRMTRFWITIEDAVKFVLDCIDLMRGGEIFIPKMPSCPVRRLIVTLDGGMYVAEKIKITGIRPGEKLHEILVSQHEADRTYDMGSYYMITPSLQFFDRDRFQPSGVTIGYSYTSETNKWQLNTAEIGSVIQRVVK